MNPNITSNAHNFDFLFVVVPIFIGVIFVITIVLMFSAKARGKMMGKQVKSMKYMLDDVKDDLKDMGTTAINVKKDIIDQNEAALTDMARKQANIRAEGIETTVRAVKNGITKDADIFCKHCGAKIPADSTFCSHCGKKL